MQCEDEGACCSCCSLHLNSSTPYHTMHRIKQRDDTFKVRGGISNVVCRTVGFKKKWQPPSGSECTRNARNNRVSQPHLGRDPVYQKTKRLSSPSHHSGTRHQLMLGLADLRDKPPMATPLIYEILVGCIEISIQTLGFSLPWSWAVMTCTLFTLPNHFARQAGVDQQRS